MTRLRSLFAILAIRMLKFESADADIRELSPLWTNNADAQLPPISAVPPGADRSQFTVITSYPVAVIERAHRIATRSRRGVATIRKLEFPSSGNFERTSTGIFPDPVLEKYPGTPRLWTPYTEDPSSIAPAKNKPLFVPDPSFLLEHGY
ncbi:Hypothetical protein NTJ_12303 [Nesidiocoris tenuis]|uniref:Spondin domain-containing protein n=1 Tax=Nesidiocoris tenuis TaxID=355587 RepID=A0ABN7B4Z4_9HEMI|nr:Hypothetical protein NTJ_12303 [Nesidiocoris tenuis]